MHWMDRKRKSAFLCRQLSRRNAHCPHVRDRNHRAGGGGIPRRHGPGTPATRATTSRWLCRTLPNTRRHFTRTGCAQLLSIHFAVKSKNINTQFESSLCGSLYKVNGYWFTNSWFAQFSVEENNNKKNQERFCRISGRGKEQIKNNERRTHYKTHYKRFLRCARPVVM